MKKIIYIIISLTMLLFTNVNIKVLDNGSIKTYAEETNSITNWSDLNGAIFITKENLENPFSSNASIQATTNYSDQPVLQMATTNNRLDLPEFNIYGYIWNSLELLRLSTSTSFNFRIGLESQEVSKGYNIFDNIIVVQFLDVREELISTNFEDFYSVFLECFEPWQEPQTFTQVNIEDHADEINNIVFKYYVNNSSKSINMNINTRANISDWVLNGSDTAQMIIYYKSQPKYGLNFDANIPDNYFSVENIEENFKRLIYEFKKDTTISYEEKNEIISLNYTSSYPTINLLTNTTWFLNPTLNFDYNNLNQLTLAPTETARQGYYIAYNYNVNEVINEYMYFNDDEYPNNYKYLVNLGFKNTLYNYDFYLYDNVNYINGELATSGFNLYDFTTNSYIDKFGVVPRIISFSYLFNTDNLNEELIFKDTATDFTPLYFYNFIYNNATEFTAEQYETYNSGYNVGYNVGVDFGTESTKWISAVFGAVDDIFQVEILPNFKLWYLIGIPLLLLAVVFIFKLLR